MDGERLYMDDLFSITSLLTDEDEDRVYETTWATTDYDLMPFNARGSYHRIDITPNGNNAFPLKVERGIQVTAVWAFSEDRTDAWEDSTDTVEDNPISAAATSVTVNDADGNNLWGESDRFYPGLLLRIESEYLECTDTNAGNNTLTVIRGRNGTTGASHVQNTQIDIWRPVEAVREAARIMVVRHLERSLQGYADGRADTELGVLRFMKKIDPEAQELLEPYRRLVDVEAVH